MKKILLLCILTTLAFAGGKVRIWDGDAHNLDVTSDGKISIDTVTEVVTVSSVTEVANISSVDTVDVVTVVAAVTEITNPVSVSGSSVTVKDDRFDGKVSTFTAGRLTADGDIPLTAFEVLAWSFKNKGGDATITGLGGIIYCLEDEPVSSPLLPLEIDSPTITVDLDVGDTFYYVIWGKENE